MEWSTPIDPPSFEFLFYILIVYPQHFVIFTYYTHFFGYFFDRKLFSFLHASVPSFPLRPFHLTLCSSSSTSVLMLNEKLFMDQILKVVENEERRGIDKFLLFTCAFIESKNYERVKKSDEGGLWSLMEEKKLRRNKEAFKTKKTINIHENSVRTARETFTATEREKGMNYEWCVIAKRQLTSGSCQLLRRNIYVYTLYFRYCSLLSLSLSFIHGTIFFY